MTARSLSTTPPFTCVTCEIEIAGPVTFHLGLPFCCAGCAAGGPCTCSYDFDPADARIRHCLDVQGAIASGPFHERDAVAAIRR
jgi:hypothetical protein